VGEGASVLGVGMSSCVCLLFPSHNFIFPRSSGSSQLIIELFSFEMPDNERQKPRNFLDMPQSVNVATTEDNGTSHVSIATFKSHVRLVLTRYEGMIED
jgi:hypothetical protein